MTRALELLVSEARSLANDGPCAGGHAWEMVGGRHCEHEECVDAQSQPVFECVKCGQFDYGEPGGPGHAFCATQCQRGLR